MPANIQPGRYQHFKGGEYEVYGLVRHSETEQLLVLYRPCYGDQALWVRPLEHFRDSKQLDGKDVPRFRYIGPSSASDSPTGS